MPEGSKEKIKAAVGAYRGWVSKKGFMEEEKFI